MLPRSCCFAFTAHPPRGGTGAAGAGEAEKGPQGVPGVPLVTWRKSAGRSAGVAAGMGLLQLRNGAVTAPTREQAAAGREGSPGTRQPPRSSLQQPLCQQQVPVMHTWLLLLKWSFPTPGLAPGRWSCPTLVLVGVPAGTAVTGGCWAPSPPALAPGGGWAQPGGARRKGDTHP